MSARSVCLICGGEAECWDEYGLGDHGMCLACATAWDESAERRRCEPHTSDPGYVRRAREATAFVDFVRRRRAERQRDSERVTP